MTGEKSRSNRALRSLREYVLVNPYEPFVEHYRARRSWRVGVRTVEGGDAAVSLARLGSRSRSPSWHEGAEQLPPDPDAPRPRYQRAKSLA